MAPVALGIYRVETWMFVHSNSYLWVPAAGAGPFLGLVGRVPTVIVMPGVRMIMFVHGPPTPKALRKLTSLGKLRV